MNKISHHSQSGVALVYILIAVALFAALSYTVADMMKGGNADDITQERAKIYANEIIDYARLVKQSVQSVRISNDCSDTDISFENNVETGYTNGTNTACQVFHADGGMINWLSPQSTVNDGSEWLYSGGNHVDAIGTSASELVLILPNIKQLICDQINTSSGITDTGTDAAIDFTKFTGSYSATETLNFSDDKMFGCLNYVNSGDNYFFYQVLIPR